MIVEFSVKNFRSIKDLQTISFAATGLKSPDEFPEVDHNNIAEDGGIRLLKAIGVYGANASGKSNIIRAFEYFLQAIKNEASSESNLSFLCDPFLYQENAMDTESFFQIVIVLDDKKYRYGFSVKKNPKYPPKDLPEKISKELVVSEWLFGTKDKNIGEFYTRKNLEVTKDKLSDSEKIPFLQYEHTLFLTHAAAFDKRGVCARIRSYLSGNTISNYIDGLVKFRFNAYFLIEFDREKELFLSFLSRFGLNFQDIEIENDALTPYEDFVPLEKIFLYREYKNKENANRRIKLNLSYNESSGTQKLFDLAGLMLRALNNFPQSTFIIVDEIDSNFHPSLLIKLIELFNNPAINKNNSQLLFTSHDTNLMSPSIMRRDQFYFTEKREDDSTRLYSLADLKGIRNDADFARDYLKGFYGALPVMTNFTENTISDKDGSMGNQD